MVILSLVLMGLCFGSFVNAFVWRLHEAKDFVNGRSECPKCGHLLGFWDLIPVVSWLLLKGRCRYCDEPISRQYPLVEIITAIIFGVSYIYWPRPLNNAAEILFFSVWLLFVILLQTLLVYDLRWMQLPDRIVYPLIVISYLMITLIATTEHWAIVTYVTYLITGFIAISGVYGILYILSKGKWIGLGDVKLGIFMGMFAGGKIALLTLILSNVIGCLVLLPLLGLGRLTPKSKVPFGPFLIVGFYIAVIFGSSIVKFYLHTVGL